MIDITGVDLRKFVQEVYARSSPQGLGMLHYQDGGLPDAEADAIIARSKDDKRIAVSMDYVRGRSCKMVVFRHGDKLEIRDAWFDHTDAALNALLQACPKEPSDAPR